MKRASRAALALTAAAALLAGCSTVHMARPRSPEVKLPANGIAGLDADAILSDAEGALKAAGSFRLRGSTVPAGTLSPPRPTQTPGAATTPPAAGTPAAPGASLSPGGSAPAGAAPGLPASSAGPRAHTAPGRSATTDAHGKPGHHAPPRPRTTPGGPATPGSPASRREFAAPAPSAPASPAPGASTAGEDTLDDTGENGVGAVPSSGPGPGARGGVIPRGAVPPGAGSGVTAASAGPRFALDLRISGDDVIGSVWLPQASGQLLTVGGHHYVRPGAEFWRAVDPKGVARKRLGDRWLRADATDVAGISHFFDPAVLLRTLLKPTTPLTKTAPLQIHGIPAIGLTYAPGVTLYIATAGRPYPIQLDFPGAEGLRFTEFGATFGGIKVPDTSRCADLAALQLR